MNSRACCFIHLLFSGKWATSTAPLLEREPENKFLLNSIINLHERNNKPAEALPAVAGRGQYPPIDVVGSVSRLFTQLATPAQQAAAAVVRRALAIYDEHRDLLAVGAYKPGGDAALDAAVARQPAIEAYLRQVDGAAVPLERTVVELVALAR